ncbi:hypothetical protein BDV95DRAFT_608003 [Massariosphaeria phaeospora]|uniref:Uncharacterized protein n=1 Tax=Massariosphaeria phaeospora TaxID=100035 RepID=A0A7C8I4W0_9PLEO|nr:hypothetical protein BDV95DRAFT_608003 [Massariosphaeria phaeospora]
MDNRDTTDAPPDGPNPLTGGEFLGIFLYMVLPFVGVVIIISGLVYYKNRRKRNQQANVMLPLHVGHPGHGANGQEIPDPVELTCRPRRSHRVRRTVVLGIVIGEDTGDGQPMTRPVTADDLTGFRPLGGIYHHVPMADQQRDFLEDAGHVVVEREGSIIQVPPHVALRPGRRGRLGHRHEPHNESVDTLLRYDDAPLEYRSTPSHSPENGDSPPSIGDSPPEYRPTPAEPSKDQSTV